MVKLQYLKMSLVAQIALMLMTIVNAQITTDEHDITFATATSQNVLGTTVHLDADSGPKGEATSVVLPKPSTIAANIVQSIAPMTEMALAKPIGEVTSPAPPKPSTKDSKASPTPPKPSTKDSKAVVTVAKDATSLDASSGSFSDDHVKLVQDIHKLAIRKGEVAATMWKAEQDIKSAKDMCAMPAPSSMPSTTQRQPVRGDWVRPKMQQGLSDRLLKPDSRVCLPLRWKKYEDDAKCGWQLPAKEKVQVLEVDATTQKFRLKQLSDHSPGDHRQSDMTSWQNWEYDESVLVGVLEKVTNLKADCEKAIFSLYSSQTDLQDTAEELQDLSKKHDSQMINAPIEPQREDLQKLQELEKKIGVANERLEQVRVLKKRYLQTCR